MRIRLWISICLIALLLTSCVRIFIPEKAEEPEEKVLDFTKKTHNYSQGTPEDYICTVLDEGVLELIDYSDKEAYFTGHVQKWKFKIIGEGTVRLLWEHVDGTLLIDHYTETYTFDAAGNYTMETDYMMRCLRYMMVGPVTDDSTSLQGYVVDFNGKKSFFSYDLSRINGITINTIFEDYFNGTEVFTKTPFIPQSQYLETIQYLLKIHGMENNPRMQLDEKSRLYRFVPHMNRDAEVEWYEYHLLAETDGDSLTVADDAVNAVIKILGDDWAKYTPD